MPSTHVACVFIQVTDGGRHARRQQRHRLHYRQGCFSESLQEFHQSIRQWRTARPPAAATPPAAAANTPQIHFRTWGSFNMHFEVERCGGSSMSVLPATTVIPNSDRWADPSTAPCCRQSREAAARKILDSATCVAASTCCAMSARSTRIASNVGVGRASDRTRAHTVLEASDGSSLLLCHELRSAGQHSIFLQHIIESQTHTFPILPPHLAPLRHELCHAAEQVPPRLPGHCLLLLAQPDVVLQPARCIVAAAAAAAAAAFQT